MGQVEKRRAVLVAMVAGLCLWHPAASGILQAQQVNAETSEMMAGKAAERDGKASLIVTPEYWIGPEDVLDVTVWRNADLSKQVTVRPDGRISLPLIGDIMAVGKTVVQLSEEISARLKEYKENPQVSIVVKEVNSYAIYVLGEVARPGKYPLKSKTTLLQAITIAGGLTPAAGRNKMVVFRFTNDGGGQIKLKASYDDIVLRGESSQNIELKPGDQIVVPSESMVLVR